MNTRLAITIIEEYINDLKLYNHKRYYKQQLMQYSYSNWAADEILRAILSNKDVSPLCIVDDFSRKMNKYSCDNNHYMFSVGYDIAIDIYDRLLAAV